MCKSQPFSVVPIRLLFIENTHVFSIEPVAEEGDGLSYISGENVYMHSTNMKEGRAEK